MKKFFGIELSKNQYVFSFWFSLLYLFVFLALILIRIAPLIVFSPALQEIAGLAGYLFSLVLLLSLLFSLVLTVFRLRNREGVFQSVWGTVIKLGCAQLVVSVVYSALVYLPISLNFDKCNPGFAGGMCDFDYTPVFVSLLLTPVLAVSLMIFAGIYRLIFKSQHNNTNAFAQDK